MIHYSNHTKQLLAATTGITLASLGLFSASASAATYHLDFDSITVDGVVQRGSTYVGSHEDTRSISEINIDDEWSQWGVNISGINYRGNGQYNSSDPNATLRLYDTRTRGGADRDLETGSDYGTQDHGNALIIQKHSNRNNRTPNDDANGGQITMDFTDENNAAKLVDFQQFTLIDVEKDEAPDEGINVFGYNAQGEKILDIDVDALVSGFYNKYSGEYNAGNLRHTNKTHDGVAYNPDTDSEPSFSFEGVTLYQEGQQLGNNTVFRFEIDEDYEAAQGLSKVTFEYADVSGAISGVQWRDVVPEETSAERVVQTPEPGMFLGLGVTLGMLTLNYQKKRQSSLDLAA